MAGGRRPVVDYEFETRAIARDAGRLAHRVDTLRRTLDRDPAALLTPDQYGRIGSALEAVGLAGAALLMNDLARSMAQDADAADPPGNPDDPDDVGAH